MEPFVDFTGRRVVVTGASSGLGRAIAIELGRRGAFLVLMGRNRQRLEETAAALPGSGSEILALDLMDCAPAAAALREIATRLGRLYGLCHCAGVVETTPVNAMNAEGLRRLYEVNVIAGLDLARVVVRRDVMEESGGSLLFISSVYASVGMPGQVGYSASKGALVSASRTMAVELARRKIRVNSLSPGLVHTRLADTALARLDPEKTKALEDSHPLGPGEPQDVAHTAAFILSPQNRWMTGADIVLDGGYSAR